MRIIFFASLLFSFSSLLGQNIFFSEDFVSPNSNWNFSFKNDTLEWSNDTAFSGVVDNQLLVMAFQEMGCVSAEASLALTNLDWNINEFELVFYIHNIIPAAPLEDNYIEANVLGEKIRIFINSFYLSNPFTLRIIKRDNFIVRVDDDNTQPVPAPDEINFEILTNGQNNAFNIDIQTRGCFADMGHGSSVLIDSIALYNEVITTTNNKLSADNLFTIHKNNQGYNLQFEANNNNEKTIYVFASDGRLLETNQFFSSEYCLNTNKLQKGIYLVKVQTKNAFQTVKIYNR